MSRSIPSLLALVLVACGGTTAVPTGSPEEVLSQSRAAAQVPPSEDSVVDPALVVASTPSEVVAPSLETTPTETVSASPEAVFVLRRGETLSHFARWSRLPVEDVAEASGLDLGGSYEVGTEVVLPLEGEALEQVSTRRAEHHERRVAGYLASRGGEVGTEVVRVRTGDSAWTIARDSAGIPLWVLEQYNTQVDLDHLRPGQSLVVPLLADVVVDAGVSVDTSTPGEGASE